MWRQTIARFAVLVVAILMTSIACRHAMVTPHSSYLTDHRFEARPSGYEIEIIPGEPTRPYIALANVSASESEVLAGVYQAQGTKAVRTLKRRARSMGGDAIIKFEQYRAPQGTMGAGSVTIQGIVVRWKDDDGEGSDAAEAESELPSPQTDHDKAELEKAMANELVVSLPSKKAARAWGRAQGFIGRFCRLKLRIVTDYVIQTDPPTAANEISYSLSRTDGGDRVEIQIQASAGSPRFEPAANQNAHILSYYVATGEIPCEACILR